MEKYKVAQNILVEEDRNREGFVILFGNFYSLNWDYFEFLQPESCSSKHGTHV
jgi:hypothetical protein